MVQFRFSGRPEGGFMSDVAGSVEGIRLGDNFCAILGELVGSLLGLRNAGCPKG